MWLLIFVLLVIVAFLFYSNTSIVWLGGGKKLTRAEQNQLKAEEFAECLRYFEYLRKRMDDHTETLKECAINGESLPTNITIDFKKLDYTSKILELIDTNKGITYSRRLDDLERPFHYYTKFQEMYEKHVTNKESITENEKAELRRMLKNWKEYEWIGDTKYKHLNDLEVLVA